MTLDLELDAIHESSSRVGESMFKSLSVPKNLCAFDIPLLMETVGDTGIFVACCVCFSISLLGLCDLRPGIGKLNLGMACSLYGVLVIK